MTKKVMCVHVNARFIPRSMSLDVYFVHIRMYEECIHFSTASAALYGLMLIVSVSIVPVVERLIDLRYYFRSSTADSHPWNLLTIYCIQLCASED